MNYIYNHYITLLQSQFYMQCESSHLRTQYSRHFGMHKKLISRRLALIFSLLEGPYMTFAKYYTTFLELLLKYSIYLQI